MGCWPEHPAVICVIESCLVFASGRRSIATLRPVVRLKQCASRQLISTPWSHAAQLERPDCSRPQGAAAIFGVVAKQRLHDVGTPIGVVADDQRLIATLQTVVRPVAAYRDLEHIVVDGQHGLPEAVIGTARGQLAGLSEQVVSGGAGTRLNTGSKGRIVTLVAAPPITSAPAMAPNANTWAGSVPRNP